MPGQAYLASLVQNDDDEVKRDVINMPDKQITDYGSMKQLLIVGGGVAGLSAAKSLEAWGARVHIVEKNDRLGGNAFDWACMATDECRNCGACLTGELVNDVERLESSRIYLQSEINKIQREGKGFHVEIKGDSTISLYVDAIILATGFEPFDPSSTITLKYTKNDKVITTRDLNRIIKTEKLPDLFKGIDVPRIAFVQCVGSRNRELGRDYCSQVCCKVALRQAEKILDLCPEAEISIFHMDLQIIGKEFRAGFRHIRDRVRLLQGVPAEIVTDLAPGSLTVFQERETDGRITAHHFDRVVLSVGMMPSSDSQALAELFDIHRDQWGFFKGEGVSLGKGIYSAGTALGPVDILGARQQGIIAAHRVAKDLGLTKEQVADFSVCVIGDGPEGQRAARELADRGFRTMLVGTGGYDVEPVDSLEYLANARLTGVTREMGKFTIKVDQGGEKRSVKADSIIVATGSEQSRVAVPGLEYGNGPLIGLAEFLPRMEKSAGDLPERVTFLLDYSGEEWKISTRNAVLAASSLAEQGREIFVIMKKMLVNGLEGQHVYDLARKNNVRFLRMSGEYPPTFSLDEKSLEITLREATLGNISITIRSDLLVIPESILPLPENPLYKDILGIEQDGEGFLQSANIRHRPVSSPRRGIFFFGTCHDEAGEDDLLNEIDEITAGLDLIRCNGPAVAQPVALINEKLCGRCLTCFRTCPHGAVMLRDSFQPEIMADVCFGCGQCASLCPASAITLDHKPGNMHEEGADQQVDTVVYMCERSAGLAEKEARRVDLGMPENTRIILVPCAGSVSIEEILAPLADGVKNIIIAGCHEGNCRSHKGRSLVLKQLKRIFRDVGGSETQIREFSVAANEPFRLTRLLCG